MTLYCPHCGGQLDVDPARLAVVLRCPHCGADFRPSDRQAGGTSVPPGALPLTVRACLSEGWQAFVTYPGMLIGGWLLYLVIMTAVGAVPCAGPIASLVLGGPMTAGLAWLMLSAVRRNEPKVGDLFEGFSRFGDCLVSYLLIGIFVALGFICLIVPGVVLALMFCLTYYLIVDRRMRAWDAITSSSRMMRGHKLTVFGLWLVLALINVLGVLALGVGLLVTVPLSGCAAAAVYRRLNGA